MSAAQPSLGRIKNALTAFKELYPETLPVLDIRTDGSFFVRPNTDEVQSDADEGGWNKNAA
jgi:hypothetical protein